MTCAVNLVPVAYRLNRARACRRRAWTVVCAVTGFLVLLGVAVAQTARALAVQLEARVADLEQQRLGVQRQIGALTAERTTQLAELERVTAARRPQPWPRRFVALTETLPDGVFLTEIEIRPAAGGVPAPNLRAAGSVPGAAATDTERLVQQVRVLGYARGHDDLLQFVNALRAQPGWRRVELARSRVEPWHGADVVAFELAGHAAEDEP